MKQAMKISLMLCFAIVLAGCENEHMTAPPPAGQIDTPDPPSVSIISPNGGELFYGTSTITWNASDPDTGETELLTLSITFSSDAGATWLPVTFMHPNDGSFRWNVTRFAQGDGYLVRITATDTTGLTASDTSDAFFSVKETIYITDRTNKDWDITHAVYRYGFDPAHFGHGLGPYAITPINDPEFISPGEKGYPEDDSSERVIGVDICADARAYPITTALSGHEVVKDTVGCLFLSVTY